MIKFTAPLLRNPFLQKIWYFQGSNYTTQQKAFIDSLKDSYESLADNIQSEESVLNLFKSESTEDLGPKASEAQVIAEYMNIMNKSYAKYYGSLSPEEQLKRSKDLIRSEVLQHDWDTFAKVNKDYQDYSLFDKNLLSIKYSNEDTKDGASKSDLNFLGDLDADVKERVQKENVYSFIYQNPANKEGAVDIQLVKSFERTEYDEDDIEWDMEENNEADARRWAVQEEHFQEPEAQPAPRLSFKAKFELFTLFNEGWSVRDLSLRYGIMPYRVKAIVYQKRYFFDEVLPHLPFSYVRDLIAIEHTFEQHYGAVDYGVDLEEMKKAEQGYLFTNFLTPHRDVDISKLSDKEQERIKNFFEKKQSKKQDIVVDKFVGHGNKGYYLKSWILHKTRSRHSVTKMFEKIIKDSDKPYKLPVTVQTRLKGGPRIAGMKFGHK